MDQQKIYPTDTACSWWMLFYWEGKWAFALSWGSFWTTPWFKLQQTEIVATSHGTLRTPNYLHYEDLNVSAKSFWYIYNSSIASILSRGNCFNMLDNHPSFKYIRNLYPLWHLAKCHHEVEDTHDCNTVAIQQHLLQLCHSLHLWSHLTIHPTNQKCKFPIYKASNSGTTDSQKSAKPKFIARHHPTRKYCIRILKSSLNRDKRSLPILMKHYLWHSSPRGWWSKMYDSARPSRARIFT